MAFETVSIQSTRNGSSLVVGEREDVAAGDTIALSLTSTVGVTSVRWSLIGRPEYSTAGGAGPEPIILANALTTSFTADSDSLPVRLDGSYIVEAILNPGSPGQVRKTVLLARMAGITIPALGGGTRSLRRLGGFESLEDTSVPTILQGWKTQLNRWLELVETIVFGGGVVETLAGAYAIGASAGDQTLVLLNVKGGGVVLDASSVGFSGVALRIVSGTAQFDRGLGLGIAPSTSPVLALGDGSSASVAAAHTGRVRYNPGTEHVEFSENGGAYFSIPSLVAAATAGLPWVRDAANSYHLPYTSGSEQVGAIVQTNNIVPGVNPSTELYQLQVMAPAFNLWGNGVVTGDTGTGESRVGIQIGQRSDATTPIQIQTGDHTYSQFGLTAKAVPVVIASSSIQFNGVDHVVPTTRLFAVMHPHSSVFSSGTTPVHVGFVAMDYWDGSFDINPHVVIDQYEGNGQFALYVGGDFCDFGQGILWGQGHAAALDCYEDVAFGSGAQLAGAGHIRRRFNEILGYWETSWNTGPYRPSGVCGQNAVTLDPTARTYPASSFGSPTVLQTIRPNDIGSWGAFHSLSPRTWVLPPRVSIPGGQLTPGIRFNLASGSSQFLLVSATATAPERTARDAIDLNVLGTWITSIDFCILNDSGSTSPSVDIAAFRVEYEVF